MKSGVYGYPVLMRAGLGNMLVPWAKCVLWCKDNNVQMIAPFWTKLRVGPYLRRERDKRQYQRLFNHGDQIAGVRRAILLAVSRRIDESQLHWGGVPGGVRPVVVCFRSMQGQHSLAERHAEVAEELRRITNPRFMPAEVWERPFVGIHVRLGDFAQASDGQLHVGAHNRRIPVQWYVEALLELRRALGCQLDARVFSDGGSEELQPLLRTPNTTRYAAGSAITELLALAKASVVIASGSAFSMWASFLGSAPTIWYPGQKFAMRSESAERRDVEWERGQSIDARFLQLIGRVDCDAP